MKESSDAILYLDAVFTQQEMWQGQANSCSCWEVVETL